MSLVARDCSCLTVQCEPTTAGLWLNPRGHFYMTVNTTEIIQKHPNHFPRVSLAAFPREKSDELLKTLGPPGMSVPRPARVSGGSSHCCFSAHKGSTGAWASLFWPCLFWFLWMQGQNCSPWPGKNEQRCCRLATAFGRCCPQGWDPISAQWVKFLLPYPWHLLFALLKAKGTSTNLLKAESHGHIFSQCQTLCWCHVPGTHLSARAGSLCPLLACTGFSRFTQQLTQASLTPQWKQILNKLFFFSFQKFF